MDNHMFEAQLHKILDTEQMGADVKKYHVTDNRTARELEVHLKRLTQKIFDKQQELEKMQIGQKINQVAIFFSYNCKDLYAKTEYISVDCRRRSTLRKGICEIRRRRDKS